MDETIREVLTEHGRLVVDADRSTSTPISSPPGMTSHASVNVMLALEDAFDIEFAESMLRKSTFEWMRLQLVLNGAVKYLGCARVVNVLYWQLAAIGIVYKLFWNFAVLYEQISSQCLLRIASIMKIMTRI